ncbi:MAG: PepSY-associated TM helix domain-containing protein [Phycisphaerae bacterium]
MRPFKKELILWTRTLHIYLTMMAVLLLFFFSITGFALNHEQWFQLNTARISDWSATMPTDLAASNDTLQLVEYLRKNQNARGEVTSADLQDDSARFQLTSPGRLTEFTITRATGDVAIHQETRNLMALLTDLHTAKHGGAVWRRVVDAAAISLFLATLTGFVLFWTLPKRRRVGIIALAGGTLACMAIYMFCVS